MGRKIYVGTFEFDKEEVIIINNALFLYKFVNKLLNHNDCEICNYLILKMKDLREEKY